MSFIDACTVYLRSAILEEQDRMPQVRFSGLVVECCVFDWGLNLHLRSAADAQDDADFASWDLSHVVLADDQSFLDEQAARMSEALDRGDPAWRRQYETFVESVSQALLGLEASGMFAEPPFTEGLVLYVHAQDEPGFETALARLDGLRSGTLAPGWSEGFLW